MLCSLETGGHALASQTSLKSARVFLGVSHGDVDDSLRVLHDHLRRIMPPTPAHFPWVAYDIWGTEATGVEEGVLAEIPVAASLGIELFYIDAGWYDGSCKNGSGDWFSGVGNWGREDRVKYPGGLAEISKEVHAAGMKFGLWFAPQVCDSRLIGSAVPVECVAQCNGADITLTVNDWPRITQICLGNPQDRRISPEGDGRRRGAIRLGLAEMGQLRTAGTGVRPRGPRASGNRWGAGRAQRPVRNLGVSAQAVPQVDARGVRLPEPSGLWFGAERPSPLARRFDSAGAARSPEPAACQLCLSRPRTTKRG